MSRIKLTKNELRDQEHKLGQLQKYLPTLQLKKALLQMEVVQAENEIETLFEKYRSQRDKIASFAALLSTPVFSDLFKALQVIDVQKQYENIAGVDIPLFENIIFTPKNYSLSYTPFWIDDAIDALRLLIESREKIYVAEEKKRALKKELRDVSIRVNLFEKIMIPRTLDHIKKIKVFLGDQELNSVAMSKVAKRKIEKRKMRIALEVGI